jgi:uracil-DNA glycosylase family 4
LQSIIDNKAAMTLLLAETCKDLAAWLRHQEELGAKEYDYEAIVPIRPLASSTVQAATARSAVTAQGERPRTAQRSPSLERAQETKPRRELLSSFKKLKAQSEVSLDQRPAEERQAALKKLALECESCTRCALHEKRSKIIFGSGPVDAKVMCLGMGLDPKENEEGRIFAGQVGELMDKMLKAMGLSREEVYITNALKCACPTNQAPTQTYYYNCLYYLLNEITLVSPKVIIAWGQAAFRAIIRHNTDNIVQLRGRWFDFHSVRVMPTFHPAYVLRNPEVKAMVWSDLKKVMAEIRE